MKKLAIVILGMSVCATAVAQTDRNNSATKLTEMKSTLENAAQLELTDEEKTLAKQWMLEDSDWVKYKNIMKGPRGIWSPGLDPLTALGVSETDPEERARYAELWMRVEGERNKLELAFEVERMKAKKKVFGDMLLVDNLKQIAEWERKRTEIRKQVLLFTEVSCQEDCKHLFQDLRASIGDNTKLDIYFNSGSSSEEIGEWASFMKLTSGEVKARKVTLNFDDGKAEAMNIDITSLPQVRVIDTKSGAVTETFK